MSMKYLGTHDFTSATVTGVGGGQEPYDAIVDSGGGFDYTTLGAAITGGAVRILLQSSTTETGAITTPSNCVIDSTSRSNLVNMQTNLLTIGATNILSNFWIRSTAPSENVRIGGDDSMFFNMYFQNNHASNPGSLLGVVDDNNTARSRIRFDNCRIQCCNATADMNNRAAIAIRNTGSKDWKFTNISINGQSSIYDVQIMNIKGEGHFFDNIYIENIGQSGSSVMTVWANDCVLSNFHFEDTNAGDVYLAGNNNQLVNWAIDSADVNFRINSSYNSLTNINTQSDIRLQTTGVHNILNNCQTALQIEIDSDYNTICGCRAGADAGGGANTIVITGTADATNIVGCRVDAAITDGGTNTTADYVVF